MSTSSSSSFQFCEYPNCTGVACPHFVLWFLSGVHFSNTDNGKLYVLFNNFGSVQQIEIYKDPNYYEILALGQGTVGLITINERNSSGITGSVIWDGTPVSFSTGAVLDCSETMSSSSTSSIDSSSTSSQSLSSESSSSTGCCEHPVCYGTHCNYFGTWNIYGMAQKNSNNCRLYIGLDYTNGYQQLRIYSDETLYDLVAIGQKSFAGTIQLLETNSSGISGSVWWDGHPIGYPEVLIIDCKQSSSSSRSSESIGNTSSSTSSSSSSSTSSTSSSESSESIGNTSSSSSSTSRSSSSSSTSQSTSSSSSIDSSSTSSESIGNTSSSSSSSLEIWNQSKPLILANSATYGITSQNRLSQAITIFDSTYEIGKVYCYLYSSNVIHSYNVNLSLCFCSDDGSPTTTITTRSIDAATINSDMWYSFDFSVNGVTPSNKLLAFVMWQDGGNEDDYIMWGYGSDKNETHAWFSNDNLTWNNQKGTIRSIKAVGIFDSIDLDNYQVNTSGATTRTILQSMNVNSSFFNTAYFSNPSRVEIDSPNLIVSFVVDASGSMGWNDRNNNRKEFITSTIQRFKDYYPSTVLFDIVKFGSKIASPQDVTSSMGQVVSINLDIRTPSRTVYVFTVEDSISLIDKSSTYSHNGLMYTVFKDYSGTFEVAMVGEKTPLSEGTLVKQSGNGPSSIVFRSVRTISVDSAFFIASGFKKMQDGHTYNFGGSYIDDTSLFTINNVASDILKWQAISPNNENPQILASTTNGPRTTSSIDIISTQNLVARTPIGLSAYSTMPIVFDVSEGSTSITVSNATSFVVGNVIDLIDAEYVSTEHTITEIRTNEITFSPPSKYSIKNYVSGGFIQNSSFANKKQLSGTTVKLYLKDSNVGNEIVFYLQSSEGYLMEWDIKATSDWLIYNIYWLGETAMLPISVFDLSGNPFSNGTRIDLEVNAKVDANAYVKASELLTETSAIGEYTIHIESTSGFVIGQPVTLIDSQGKVQQLTISEVGEDAIGPYITFTDPLTFEFSPSNGASIVTSSNPNTEIDNSPVSVNLSLVDVTPICTDTILDESKVAPYDLPAVPPNTTYENLNNSISYIRHGVVNVPSIKGVAVIRVLPITEDVLKSNFEKSNDITRQLNLGPPEDLVGQGTQNEGDLSDVGEVTQTTTTTSNIFDYTIESPVYLYNGSVESAMTTSSTKIEKVEFPELTIPGISSDGISTLDAVTYKVYPAIVEVSTTNVVSAKQYFDYFSVYFVSPYGIYSEKDSKNVSYQLPYYNPPPPEGCGEFLGYKAYTLPGVYATSATENADLSYTIDYVVTNKLLLVSSAQMRIRLYSNSTINQEALALNGIVETQYDLNIKYNPVRVLQPDGTYKTTTRLSPIDTWRAIAEGDVEALQDAGTSTDITANDTARVYDSALESAISGLEGRGYKTSDSTPTVGPINLFYSSGWEQAKQYAVYDITINVVNGLASFTVPPSDQPSAIIVEASIPFGDNFEAIRSDAFVVRNPIVVGAFVPNIINVINDKIYELSLPVSWQNGSDIIDDGTIVNIKQNQTQINPLVSETSGGQANGLFIGEKDLFFYDDSAECPDRQQLETVVVTVTHPQSGYSVAVNRIICWEGTASKGVDSGSYFSIIGDNVEGYADGSPSTEAKFSSNLFGDIKNAEWIPDDGIQRLMGKDQPNGLRREVWYGTSNEFILSPARMQWQEDGSVSFTASALNKNIGVEPITVSVGFNTDYYVGTTRVILQGISDLDEFNLPVVPEISLKEPLGISLQVEKHKDVGFVRNGIDTANVVATITWKGEKINSIFVDPQTGATIPYQMPSVTFMAGKCFQRNGGEITDSRGKVDAEPLNSTCLIISEHKDISLSSTVVQSSLIRTDIYDDTIGNIHTHACLLNDNGDGNTTSTIILDGIIADHTHNITNYQSDSVLSHIHGVRSVAITQINPMTNTGIEISVNGYVVYDPTGCLPNDNGSKPFYFPIGLPNGNRIMFDTVNVLGYTTTEPTLELVVETGMDLNLNSGNFFEIPLEIGDKQNGLPSYFVANSPNETLKGFDIKVTPKFSRYMYESSPGVPVIVDEQSVNDGTRVTFEIIPYKAKSNSSQSGPHIVSPDIVNKYMILKFIVSANANGMFATRAFYIPVDSNLQWIPGVTNLMEDVSNDSSYISTALNGLDGWMGSSQLHDAVMESAQKIIQEQVDHPEYKQYEKIIFIVSDGDENKSLNSINQAINNISFIDGQGNTPTVNIVLGNADPSDGITLRKYAASTNGNTYSMNNMNTSMINDTIDFIVANNNTFNYGTFKNLITFEEAVIPISFNLGQTYVPLGTMMNFRVRQTTNGIQWSPWTAWRNSESSEIAYVGTTEKILQYQYEVQFYGDKYFNSPILYGVPLEDTISSSSESEGGTSSSSSSESIEEVDNSIQGAPSIEFYSSKSLVLFFKPISVNTNQDEYISSVLISHEADIPSTSKIEYGIVQSNDTDVEYYEVDGKSISPDKNEIMLTRYNEPLFSNNLKFFAALNGKWPEKCSIEIYRFNSQNPDGIIVNSSEYIANSKNGGISFFNAQPDGDSFTINVIFRPFFRLIAKITNYGEDFAVIHHISMIYNISKRVPRASNGNIIHKPINQRL